MRGSSSILFLLLSLIFIPVFVFPQIPNLKFERLTMEDGLPGGQVQSIYQDSKGFMWFGTQSGLSRYDGLTMKNYIPDPKTLGSISLSSITDILEDSQGKLWFTGFNFHINCYDPEKNIFTEYTLPDAQKTVLQRIYEDKRGNLWVGSWDLGIWRFDRQKKQLVPFPVPLPKGVEKEKIFCISGDSHDNLWFGVSNGVYTFSYRDSSFNFYPLPGGIKGSKGQFVTTIYEDGRNRIWIGTYSNGIFLLDRKQNNFINYRNELGKNLGLTSNWIRSIAEDQNGRFWIGTGSGLSFFDPVSNRFFPFKDSSGTLEVPEEGEIWTIFRDREDNMWLGLFVSGVSYWSSDRKGFQSYQYRHSIQRDNGVKFFYERKDGQLWIAFRDGLTRFDPVSNQFYRSIDSKKLNFTTFFEDEQGWLWTGTWNKGLYKAHPESGQIIPLNISDIQLNDPQTPYIFRDRQGEIWTQLRGKELYRFDSNDNSFKPFPLYHAETGEPIAKLTDAFFEDQRGNLWLDSDEGILKIDPDRKNYTHYPFSILPVHSITSILEGKEGGLWIGTYNKGLVHFNPVTKAVKFWTQTDGLPSNIVMGLLKDGQSNLWISTRNGLSRFNPETEQFRNYDRADGLPSNHFNHNPLLKTKNGEMYFGTKDGFVRFYPDSIRDNPNIPTILISDIKINNKVVPIADTFSDTLENKSPLNKQAPYAKSLSLLHWQKDLYFEFRALNYLSPEKNQYQYRLVNYDKDWISTDAGKPFANYTNLSPGHYTFRVKGSNNDGVWNEKGATLAIYIQAPWWQRWWAYALYIMTFILLLTGLYLYQRRRWQLQANFQLEKERANRLDEINRFKSRFYTNITHEFRTPLTVIKGMANQINGPEKSKKLIQRNSEQLLGMVNQLLDLSKLESNSMGINWVQGDVIPFLKYLTESCHSLAQNKYLNLAFFSKEEQLIMDFDEKKLQLILINLLSNAIKFTPEYGSVKVIVTQTFKADKPYLELVVEDTGKGIPEHKLPHIFDRFYQADPDSYRDNAQSGEGSGIGLALLKEMVKLLDGKIEVESVVNKGTMFRVLLPVFVKESLTVDSRGSMAGSGAATSGQLLASSIKSPVPPSPEEELISQLVTSNPQPTINNEQSTILIIEDNADVTEYIISCLDQKYSSHYARNGKEGIEKALEIVPDFILCDVMMPELDGFEVCKRLKQDRRTSHIPIIMLTAKATQEDKVKGLTHGADAYLTKPFDKEELLVRLKNLALQCKRLREHLLAPVHLQEEPSEAEAREAAFLEEFHQIIISNIGNASFNTNYLGKAMAMSRSQLYRKLKALTGQPVANYIRSIRLQKAKSLLETTDLPIGEIALQVGYKDFSHFSRSFAKEFSVKPSEMRK